jgi:FMN-dependent NADH-azoreductase
MKILQIKSGVFSASGQSSRLADEFVALLRQQSPGAEMVERDLATEPVPHLDGARVAAFFAKPQERRAEQNAVVAYSDALIAGETFKYTDKDAVGLLTGKRAYVFAARGGVYAGTPNDWQTQYVRFFLGFLGITDVEFVYAEGLALGEESRNKGIAAAQAGVRRAAAQWRLAA